MVPEASAQLLRSDHLPTFLPSRARPPIPNQFMAVRWHRLNQLVHGLDGTTWPAVLAGTTTGQRVGKRLGTPSA